MHKMFRSKLGSLERLAPTVHILRLQYTPKIDEDPLFVCENPDAEQSKRIYARRFDHAPLYFPDEYEIARANHLRGKNVVVLGANGYSDLDPKVEQAWGLPPGSWKGACADLISDAFEALQLYRGIDIRFANGASYKGIDAVLIDVAADRYNRPQLGHSCIEYLRYVPDRADLPIHVAKTKHEYADRFTSSVDILIGCNGRKQAFEMDTMAMLEKQKLVYLADVAHAISARGGPPAFVDRQVENATAAVMALLVMLGSAEDRITPPNNLGDLSELLCKSIVQRVRTHGLISADCAYNPGVREFTRRRR